MGNPQYGAPYFGYAGDPVVPDPQGGFGAWWNKTWSIFANNWQQLFLIALITSVLPGIVGSIILGSQHWEMLTIVQHAGSSDTLIFHWHAIGIVAAIGLLFGIVGLFANAIGWVAGIWVVTRRGVGSPAPLGAALAYGVRNCLRVGGILLLVGLMTLAGAIACFVPGLYILVASSLVVPFAVFDRGSGAISSSFRAVNRNFGAVLGRLVVATVVFIAASFVFSCLAGAIFPNASRFGTSGTGPSPSTFDIVGSSILTSVLDVPLTMFFLVGLFAIYAQVRARAVPTTAADLNAALGA